MVLSLKDFNKCCRCCLTMVNALKPIFGASLDVMLTKVMSLQITENDGYPQQICSRCIMKLSSTYTFYQTVMSSKNTMDDVLKAAEGNVELYATAVNCDVKELNIQENENNTLEDVRSVQHFFSAQEAPSKSTSESDIGDSYQCPQCQHTSTDAVVLEAHLETHLVCAEDQSKGDKDARTELCNYCGARFRLRTSLHKHLRQHRGLHHECPRCRKRFAEASTLAVHLVSHSADPKPFRCACGLAFTQKSTLRKHERRHAAREQMQCADCGKTFLHKSSLQRHHERLHSAQECTICCKTYSGQTSLNAHMKAHRAEIAALEIEAKAGNTMTEQINIQAVTVEFLCLICSKKYQTRESLEMHYCELL